MATRTEPKPGTIDATLATARSTMVFSEIVRLAVDTFRASKVRFLLTMLGMVIGSASIILVYTVGLTGRQYAIDKISSLGPNKVEMQYAGGNVMGPDNTSTPDFMTRERTVRVDPRIIGRLVHSRIAVPAQSIHDNQNRHNNAGRNNERTEISLRCGDFDAVFDGNVAARHRRLLASVH